MGYSGFLGVWGFFWLVGGFLFEFYLLLFFVLVCELVLVLGFFVSSFTSISQKTETVN